MVEYNIKAKAKGRFDSKLESRWYHRLTFRFTGVAYIGDTCNFADFEVAGFFVEIKPRGIQFVKQAHERAKRYKKSIVIIEGDSDFLCRWWVSTSTGILQEISKPSHRETIEQCLIRNGLIIWS